MAALEDLKFSATHEKLVDHYLRNRIYTGRDGFIKDIKLYEYEPWLLPHVNNNQFKKKNWYYFVVRTLRHGKTPKRPILGLGGMEVGIWKTTGRKQDIRDRNNDLIGFRNDLSYYKNVIKGEKKLTKTMSKDGDTTGWCMTEYWLASEDNDKDKDDSVFQEVVLCWLRDNNNESTNHVHDQPHLTNIIPIDDPTDLRFCPTDERLVEYFLRNRVDSGKDGFIKDIQLYEYEPWLLPHVNNDQFKENEWFYFVVRTKRGGSGLRTKRFIQGRGDSEGGAWTITGQKKKIHNIAFKRELAYYKKVEGTKKGETTGWYMTEYWLESDENKSEFQKVFLCHIRDTKKKNNIVVEQPQDEENTVAWLDDDKFRLELLNMYDIAPEDMVDERLMFDIDDLLDISQQAHYVDDIEKITFEEEDQDSGHKEDVLKEYLNELENWLEEDQDSGHTEDELKEYVNELENLLEDDQDSRHKEDDLKEYANELENWLEEDDEDKAFEEQQHRTKRRKLP